jgi:1-acyl-sn-glycerol-3-phosphate acyltransferase
MAAHIEKTWSAIKKWVPFSASSIGAALASVGLAPFSKDKKINFQLERRWARVNCKRLNIDVQCTGLENVPAAPFVYCSNHQSIVDIIALRSVLAGDYRWAAKRSVMRIPFMGWHMWLAGHIPVDRGQGPSVAARVTERMEERLQQGYPVLVFAEGTRSANGVIQPFKRGAFIAAVRAGVPIVPVAIDGAYQLMSKHKIDFIEGQSTRISVKIGAPIYPKNNLSEENQVEDLRERSHAAVVQLHQSINGRLAANTTYEAAAE